LGNEYNEPNPATMFIVGSPVIILVNYIWVYCACSVVHEGFSGICRHIALFGNQMKLFQLVASGTLF
jgi:hypothetical protein